MAYPYVQTLAALAGAATLAGCVGGDADANIVILRNQAQANDCVSSAEAEGTFNSAGAIDTRSPGGYVFTPVVRNFAAPIEGDSTSRIAFLSGARVDIHFSDQGREDTLAGVDGLTRFEVPLSGAIEPGGTAGLIFEIVPGELLPQITTGDILLVDIRMVGEMDGSSFVGATFRYPIEVCTDCTVVEIGACSGVSRSYEPAGVANGCNYYQDTAVECCTSDGGLLVCPAVGTME